MCVFKCLVCRYMMQCKMFSMQFMRSLLLIYCLTVTWTLVPWSQSTHWKTVKWKTMCKRKVMMRALNWYLWPNEQILYPLQKRKSLLYDDSSKGNFCHRYQTKALVRNFSFTHSLPFGGFSVHTLTSRDECGVHHNPDPCRSHPIVLHHCRLEWHQVC